jgi:xanthine dehydrogenase iron-sulfur cluster and FAD-binding subunit A
MSGNLCRCGAYANIVPAVLESVLTDRQAGPAQAGTTHGARS